MSQQTSSSSSCRTSFESQSTKNEPEVRKDASESPQMHIAQITSRGEEHFERYGGDDIHEPPPKEFLVGGPKLEQSETTIDANMITWDSPNDPLNPQNWSTKYKWFVTVVCTVITINVTFASSAPSSATIDIMKEFNVSHEVSYLITTVFLLGYVFGSLFWGPGSELVGRKPIFVLSMVVYTLFYIGQALAPNIQTLLVTRFLSGFFSVAPLTNCGGVIADIWSAVGRRPATTLFAAGLFLGTVAGPIVSGYIVDSSVSWRWVFWVMMIFAGVCTVIMIILLPETYAPVILLKKKHKLVKEDPVGSKDIYAEHEKQDWSITAVIQRTIFRPFHMLALEPILVMVTIYLSVVYGLLFGLFEAFPIIFVEKRGFTIAEDGLIFIGVGTGTTIGAVISYFTSVHYPELIKKWKGFPPPENRLFGAMIGSPILVIGIFWLGWTGQYANIPWYVPALSTIFLGVGISLIFMSFLSYLIDTYLMYSASALAANTAIRSAVAAAFPLFTVQLFTNLGINWACTLIGCIALLFLPSPFLFYKYGARIRAHSKFAPCIDLQIAADLENEKKEFSKA